MEADSGLAVRALRVDGGLTRSSVLMQLQADLLGLPVDVSGQPEATALGICYLVARAAGLWASDTEITRRVTTARRFEPQIAAAERATRLARFAAAVAAVTGFAA